MKDEWKDIASASKDGRLLLLFGSYALPGYGRLVIGNHRALFKRNLECDDQDCFTFVPVCGKLGWYDIYGNPFHPTHWMELPRFPYLPNLPIK